MRSTIKDVAAQAGVSTATVSRILRSVDTPIRVSKATRERVLAAVQALNYTPDAMASGLRSQRSRIIGVIVPDASMAFPASVISILDDVLEQRGYEFLLAQAQTAADVQRFSQLYERYRVGGVLFVGSAREVLDDSFLAEYSRRLGGHVVGLCCKPGPPLRVSVDVDNRKGVWLALEHLVSLGHKRIAFAGAHRSWDMVERFEAYRDFLAAAGLEPTAEYAIQDTPMPNPHAGAEAMRRLLALGDPPSAVLFGTDEMAVAGMMVAQQAGCVIPRDVAVVGFDDILWASYCWPPLTTLRQPARAMVRQAVEALVDLVEERPLDEVGEAHIFAPELVVRASTAGA